MKFKVGDVLIMEDNYFYPTSVTVKEAELRRDSDLCYIVYSNLLASHKHRPTPEKLRNYPVRESELRILTPLEQLL